MLTKREKKNLISLWAQELRLYIYCVMTNKPVFARQVKSRVYYLGANVKTLSDNEYTDEILLAIFRDKIKEGRAEGIIEPVKFWR